MLCCIHWRYLKIHLYSLMRVLIQLGRGGDNYSFLDIIMGFSASCVFRKLHGNNFTVKCSIIRALTLLPPVPPKVTSPRNKWPERLLISKVKESRYFQNFTVALITVVASRTRCVTYRRVRAPWSPWKAQAFHFRIKGCFGWEMIINIYKGQILG